MFSSIRCWVKRYNAMIQALFHFFIIIPAFADCFQFDKVVMSPIIPLFEKRESGKKEISSNGSTIEATWASDFGVINKPIGRLLEMLMDHNLTKSPKIDEMEVKSKASQKNWTLHSVHFVTKPFLFINIDWTESWGFYKNNPVSPTEALISYEKTEGTKHIRHLCGNISLKKLDENKTMVLLYEQASATQRSVEDTAKGLQGTLRTLKEEASL